MIAMTVMVVVASSLGVTIVSSNNLSRQSRETRIASMELVRMMEWLSATSHGNIPVLFIDDQPIQQDSVLENLTITPDYPNMTAGDPIPSLLMIELRATWTGFDRSERSLTLTSAKGS